MTIGLIGILLPAIIVGLVASRNGKPQQYQRQDAVNTLEQTMEALRTIRETAGWNSFATDGMYYVQQSGTIWTLVSTTSPHTDPTTGFTTEIDVNDVWRNKTTTFIVPANSPNSTVDVSTKQVVVKISWTQPTASSTQSIIYMTRYLGNLSFIQTLTTDFNQGTLSGTAVENTPGSSLPNDGDVILGSGGQGNWCQPSLSINSYDMPGQGIATAISATAGLTVGSPDHAYATTGGNSSGDSLDSVVITDPSSPNPPVASSGGAYNNYKTYGIFATQNYIYLTSDHPGETVDIVNALTLQDAGLFNSVKGNSMSTVFISGNTGFVTAGNTLYSFDVTTIKGINTSQTQLGSIALDGTGGRVYVVNGYAYVTTASTTGQLQIFDVSSPSSMKLNATLNAGNNQAGVDVIVNSTGSTAYLATNYSGHPDFFKIDVTNKSSPTITGSYNTNGMSPKAVTLTTANKAIVVGSSGEQYQVLDISGAPTLCGGLTNPNGASSVNAVTTITEADGDAFAYILTNNSTKEFQIIAGGPGAQFASNGTFTSSIIPTPMPQLLTAINNFQVSVNRPSGTDITLQAAVSKAVNGSCSNAVYTFVGPDGTSATEFHPTVTTSKTTFFYGIPPAVNPGQCFKYQAVLSTTDTTTTPNLYDFTINYSP